MGAPALGILSKPLNRFNTFHLFLLALTVTLLILTFALRSPDSSLGSVWRHAPRPHQAYVSSKVETDDAVKEKSSVSETNPANEYDNVASYLSHIHELGDGGKRFENPTKYL